MTKPIFPCPIAILAICCLLSPTASAQDFFYYYLGEPIHLTTTPNILAVYDRAQGQDKALENVFEDAQIETTQMEPHPIGAGWHTVTIPMEEVSAFGDTPSMIATLVDQDTDGRFFFSPVFLGPEGGSVIVPPEVLVLFEDDVEQTDVTQLLHDGGVLGASRTTFAQSLGMAFKVSTNHNSGVDVLEVANRLTEMSEVVFAEPDMIISGNSASYVPNEPEFDQSWWLRNYGQFNGSIPGFDIGATEAWCGDTPNEPEFGNPDVITVVIETGIQQDHPDIHQIPGRDFTFEAGDGGPINECDNHGTPVAGVISGKVNGLGTAGVAPNTRIASARAFISRTDDGTCQEGWYTEISWTVDALQWAVDIGARITNNSNIYAAASNAITLLYKQSSSSLLHFASAGNTPGDEIAYPATLFWVQAVTAMNWDGTLWNFSSFGPQAAFTAPGVTILSTDRTPPNGWSPFFSTTFGSGTSFASPMAAGVAALVLSQNLQQTPFDVLNTLRFTATDLGTPGPDAYYGLGLVNAEEAVKVTPLSLIFFDDFETGDMSYWSAE